MSTRVNLERIDSALLTYSEQDIHFDSSYDGGVYSNFSVSQRGSETISIETSSFYRTAFFAFKIPDQYIGYHSGEKFYLKATDQGAVLAKIFPCFEDPRNYLNAGCDHINKKISWGDLYGSYCYGAGSEFYNINEFSKDCYTTNATSSQYNSRWGNLLDPCGAKYIILLLRNMSDVAICNPTLAIDIDTNLPCAYIDAIYPNNISIKKNISHDFLWNVIGSDYNPQNRNNIRKDSTDQSHNDVIKCSKYTFTGYNNTHWDGYKSAQPCPTYLKSHTLYYRKKGTSQYTQISETNDHAYVEVPADTFDLDRYEYYVAQTLEGGYTVYTPLTEFTAIGQNAAPTINSVSNNAIPTIAWTDQNQAAFEIRIKDSEQNIIYKSGLIAGTAQSYRINKMLSNGTYTVEVRELNIYGLYSEWGSYLFTINPSAVSAPTNIFATVNNKYGVEISGTPAAGATKTYVVRREHGSDDIEIIGIYTGGIFEDYTAKANIFYEYTLRNYNTAYADGEWIPLQIVVDKVLIQDGRDKTNFVKLSLSEDATFDVNWTEEVDRTLYSCLGRKYPVKEPGEWVNSIRTFTAYVENMDKLQDINLNAPKVYIKSDNEYFAADMIIEDKGSYVGGGRIVAFTLTRIADDEGITLL